MRCSNSGENLPRERERMSFTVIARSEATKQSTYPLAALWIASRSLSSGARSRDPLARNDGDRLFRAASARRFQPLFRQEPHRGVGVHRFAEGKALRVFAAQLVELDRIGIGLGAFGDHVHAEVVGQRND
jgi:hypothetical protein